MTPDPAASVAGSPLTPALQRALDILHRAGLHRSLGRVERLSGALFTIIEDGGEQIVLSLVCLLALLIRRDVRAHPATPRAAAVK